MSVPLKYGPVVKYDANTEDMAKIIENGARKRVAAFFKKGGFRFVTLELEGYRPGSANKG
ncbi:MAG: hypothetical protein ACP5SH_27100 [Syntrophobacteraceae bacterium]